MANMERNQGTQGNQGNQIRCQQCNKDFNSQQELQDHNRQMHNR